MSTPDQTREPAGARHPAGGAYVIAPLPDLRDRVRDVIAAALLLAFYLGLEWVSSIHEYRGVPLTPWNPGLGFVFAAMVMRGPAFGLVLFTGVVLAELLVLRTQLTWPVILGIAASVSASYATAAALARGRLGLDLAFRHVRDVLVLLVAGILGAAACTVLLSGLLVAAGELDVDEFYRSSLPLFIGDVIGIAVVTPLVLRLAVRRPPLSLRALAPLMPEAGLYLAVGGLALAMTVAGDSPSNFAFLSLLFLPVVAAAIRHGIDGASLTLAATQLGLVALLHRHGYDTPSFTAFQVVMFVLTTTALLVGVVVSERREAALAAQRAERERLEMQAQALRVARLNMVSGMASALAHEVNQPLTAARALARSAQELMRSPGNAQERASENIAALIGQIDHAGGVVRRIREFLRRGNPHTSTLDVAGLLREAVALAQPEATTKGVRLELTVADGLRPLYGDRVQLQQVVLNLVRNAMESIVEAEAAHGLIRVRAALDDSGEAVEFSVADNGPGVPQDLDLFEPLVSSRPDGIGLGLSICASIVKAHGGRIWLQSGEPGATEFRFSLPFNKDLPA